MKRLPVWFERTENLAIAVAVVVVFVRLHFSWWWLPVFFLAFDVSMAGYLADNRVGAVCYNLAHAYVAPAALLIGYVVSDTRWCAFVGLLWAFHIAGDRVLGYGLKFATSFQDTHLGKIGKQPLPACWHPGSRQSKRSLVFSAVAARVTHFLSCFTEDGYSGFISAVRPAACPTPKYGKW